MPAKRSSTSGALSWILAVVLVSVAAIGVGWLIGQQVLNWLNPRSSVSKTDSGDTGYNYYPWSDSAATSTDKTASSGTPTIQLPVSTVDTSAASNGTVASSSTSPTSTSATSATSSPATQQQSTPVAAAKLWKVRVGSFATREQAVAAGQELAAQGYPIFVTGNGPWAVQVGAFGKRENAIALGDTLADQGYDVLVTD